LLTFCVCFDREAFGVFIQENTSGKRLLERAAAGIYPVFAKMITFLLKTIDAATAAPIQKEIYQLGPIPSLSLRRWPLDI